MSVSAMKTNPLYAQYIDDYLKDDVIKEALRQSEKMLEQQQTLSTAADRRSITFIAIYLVLIGFLTRQVGTDVANSLELLAIVSLLCSTVFAAFSARPVRFYGSGSSASQLKKYLDDGLSIYTLAGLAERNDEAIEKNDVTIKRASNLLNVSLGIAFVSLLMILLELTGWIS